MITRDKLASVTAICRMETLRHYRSDSCIASVRVLGEVLHYFGHTSEPLPCAAAAFNAVGWDAQEREEPLDASSGAWSVGITGTGVLRPTGGWDGHLIAIVDGQWLVDPSLDQFARPERGITIGPVVLDAGEWADRTRFHAWRKDNGVVLSYGPMKHQGLWRQAPDWKAHRIQQRAAIGAAIRTLRAAA